MDWFSGRYSNKIKTADEIARLVGDRPRKRKVIMCHGVFDVVHPGHIRHMAYAKTKADVLIASLTADVHVTKCRYRPHVPEGIRATNLAAFDFVDYVIVDGEATPLKSIERIKPDYFAKGYEYQAVSPFSKTQEEMDILRSYGGDIIFTPGDFVFSSSQLIENSPPNLRIEKLLSLMADAGISFDSLRGSLDRFGEHTVHVVGDTIVDSITRTNMIGGHAKTPTISVQFENRTDYIGGAAIVALHLRAAGAQVSFSTVVGNDELGDFVLDGLAKEGVHCRAIVDQTRPTTHKNAIVANGYRLLKLDTLDNQPISEHILVELSKSVSETPANALVFSDFRHGIFNRYTIPILSEAIPRGVYKAADSQVASRWGNITDFKGFDLIAPNEREARFSLGNQDLGVRPIATALHDATGSKMVILKLADKGVLTTYDGRFFVVDSFVDRLVDGVGAGDAMLAYSTLGMLATGSQVIATILGTMAAACECERDGNIPISVGDVHARLESVEREALYK